MPRAQILPTLLLMLTALTPAASIAGESRIELADGSVIHGELLGIEGGRYHVRTATLGEIAIPESQIRALQPLTGGAEPTDGAPEPAADYSGDIAALQKRLVMDQGLMEQINALQQDPEIQQALADPELSRMILSADLQRLKSDPRFQQLMAHPSIQAIIGQVIGR